MRERFRYVVKVRHWNQESQITSETFARKWEAEKYMRQQVEIAMGHEKRTGFEAGAFVVFNDDGTYKTTMWIARVKVGRESRGVIE